MPPDEDRHDFMDDDELERQHRFAVVRDEALAACEASRRARLEAAEILWAVTEGLKRTGTLR